MPEETKDERELPALSEAQEQLMKDLIREGFLDFEIQSINPGWWSYDIAVVVDHDEFTEAIARRDRVTESDLFDVFNECLNVRPHLIIEVGFNRIAEWGVHIYDGTGVGIKNAELIISTQSGDRAEAMSDAVKQLQERFLSNS